MATTIIDLVDSDDDGEEFLQEYSGRAEKLKSRRHVTTLDELLEEDSDDDDDDEWLRDFTTTSKKRRQTTIITTSSNSSSEIDNRRPNSRRVTILDDLLEEDSDDDDDDEWLRDFTSKLKRRKTTTSSSSSEMDNASHKNKKRKTLFDIKREMLAPDLRPTPTTSSLGIASTNNSSTMGGLAPEVKREMMDPAYLGTHRPTPTTSSSFGIAPTINGTGGGGAPEVVERRRAGRYVEYRIRYSFESYGYWKKIKEMTDTELEAKNRFLKAEKDYQEYLKNLSDQLAEYASEGRVDGMNQILKEVSYEELEPHLCESINRAKIYESDDVNDWGRTKNTMYFYEDTPLIEAVREGNIHAVHALLSTGLCDPTLASTNWDCMDGYSVPESHQWTALRVCNEKLRPNNGPAADKIRALLMVALNAWPKASYCSPDARWYHDDSRKKKKYNNRMRFVRKSCLDQSQMREVLQRELMRVYQRLI